jgi:uncharacterized protein (DUF2147 family)
MFNTVTVTVKMIKTSLVYVLVYALFAVAASPVLAQMTPVGTWHTLDDETGKPKAEVRIVDTGDGELTGTVIKSLVPITEKNQAICGKCEDDRKDKPKLGMEIIRGAKQTSGTQQWEGGTILDPNKGKIYRLRLQPLDDGKHLQVRGYIGPFYRTQVWNKPVNVVNTELT